MDRRRGEIHIFGVDREKHFDCDIVREFLPCPSILNYLRVRLTQRNEPHDPLLPSPQHRRQPIMSTPSTLPEGITSYLDTDLYKLTMQNAILRFFPTTTVEYTFTNRTPDKRLTRAAFGWLQDQISRLGNLRLRDEEKEFLRENCSYLKNEYLEWLAGLVLRPDEQVRVEFVPVEEGQGGDAEEEVGDVKMLVTGLWVETVLYEIPLLALTSEAYFKFVDRDWDHEGQEEAAYRKGLEMFRGGCMVNEFGSRRRRDGKTQDLVLAGLKRASDEVSGEGKLTGTSNVFFAMKHKIPPSGTVAHEWYMGIASINDDYQRANEIGLQYWVECYGEGVLGIALTDTFGTPAFFKAFEKKTTRSDHTYAEVFQGIRQDSGDPKDYVKMASDFYTSQGITGKNIVFSDSLNVEKCLEYKAVAEQHGFVPSFGVGTFLTNDFACKSDSSKKSKPLNIVIKVSKANGRPSVKISDNIGKNTGDKATVERVKSQLGYTEHEAPDIDEKKRW